MRKKHPCPRHPSKARASLPKALLFEVCVAFFPAVLIHSGPSSSSTFVFVCSLLLMAQCCDSQVPSRPAEASCLADGHQGRLISVTRSDVQDKNGRREGEAEYDPTSLLVPAAAFVDKSLTPFEIQYWKIKKVYICVSLSLYVSLCLC